MIVVLGVVVGGTSLRLCIFNDPVGGGGSHPYVGAVFFIGRGRNFFAVGGGKEICGQGGGGFILLGGGKGGGELKIKSAFFLVHTTSILSYFLRIAT